MFTHPLSKAVRRSFLILGIAIVTPVAFIVATHPAPNASAQVEATTCTANGEVADGANGGVVFTVTTSGLCESKPLQLIAVDSKGNQSILESKDLVSQTDGKNSASLVFTPNNVYASYQVVIDKVFSATVNAQ